jgi:hypothetical protein
MTIIHQNTRRKKSPGGALTKWLVICLLLIITCGIAWLRSHGEAKASEPDMSLLKTAYGISSINANLDQAIGSPLVIPPAAFTADSPERRWVSTDYIYPWNGNYCGIAALHLPDGARIREFAAYVVDNDAAEHINVYLYAKPLGSTTNSTTMASLSSEGQNADLQLLVDTTINQAVIYNNNYTYHIGLCLWGVDSKIKFYAAKLSYTLPVYLPTVMKSLFSNLGFDSQFNGSSTGWTSIAGIWSTGANDFYTSGNEELWSSAAYNVPFTNLDYQVRMIRYGSDDSSNQLIIRGVPTPLSTSREWYSEYIFQYTRSGYYSIWKTINGGGTTALQNWTLSPSINNGDAWNTLRVIAIGSNLYYYINGALVWSGTEASLSSGAVGFGMYRPSPSSGDMLRVDWATLYTNDSILVMDVVNPSQQALNDAANLTGGGDVTHSP